MNVILYAHGWIGAGVAAALYADPDTNPTFVTYPDTQYNDEHPCDVANILASIYPYYTFYRWPSYPPTDGCDAVITANWRHVLDPVRYENARLGGFNIHNSLLPDYKGRRPLQRALADKATALGYTIHRLTKEIDSGEILSQRILHHISARANEGELYQTFGLLVGHDLLRILKEQQ